MQNLPVLAAGCFFQLLSMRITDATMVNGCIPIPLPGIAFVEHPLLIHALARMRVDRQVARSNDQNRRQADIEDIQYPFHPYHCK